MYLELGENPKDPDSLFQKFLQNCPEALNHLFDHCFFPEGGANPKGRTSIDFFLFTTIGHSSESELTILRILFAAGKYKLLDHPLFEIFIMLKWEKVWKFYSLVLFFLLLHIMAILGFSLVNFSNILPLEYGEEQLITE